VGVSVALTSALMSIITMTAGFMAVGFPLAVEYINYANPLRYGTTILAVNDLEGLTLTCEPAQQLPNGACLVPDGDTILAQYNMKPADKEQFLWVLAILVIALRVLVYVLLRVRLFLRRLS
jgi:hypothetical protein